jgi:hypothetical protein
MIIQYPDTATMQGKPAESTLNNGVWEPATPVADITQIGRYEPSTLNREVQLTDGSMAKLKGIFYMPVNAPDVDMGVDFQVVNRTGDIVLKTKVLFFSRGQLNCRVYL